MATLSVVLSRLAASASIAVWTAFVPLALDLAHPVFSDCGEHGAAESSAGPAEFAAAGRAALDESDPREHASDSNCPVHGVPSRDGVPCCADGGCFCCGAVGLPSLQAGPLPAPVRSVRFPFEAELAPDGVSPAVFHPPRS